MNVVDRRYRRRLDGNKLIANGKLRASRLKREIPKTIRISHSSRNDTYLNIAKEHMYL